MILQLNFWCCNLTTWGCRIAVLFVLSGIRLWSRWHRLGCILEDFHSTSCAVAQEYNENFILNISLSEFTAFYFAYDVVTRLADLEKYCFHARLREINESFELDNFFHPLYRCRRYLMEVGKQKTLQISWVYFKAEHCYSIKAHSPRYSS